MDVKKNSEKVDDYTPEKVRWKSERTHANIIVGADCSPERALKMS